MQRSRKTRASRPSASSRAPPRRRKRSESGTATRRMSGCATWPTQPGSTQLVAYPCRGEVMSHQIVSRPEPRGVAAAMPVIREKRPRSPTRTGRVSSEAEQRRRRHARKRTEPVDEQLAAISEERERRERQPGEQGEAAHQRLELERTAEVPFEQRAHGRPCVLRVVAEGGQAERDEGAG